MLLPRVAPLFAIVLGVAACGGAKPAASTPSAETHPLAGIVGQNIIIAPVQSLRMPADVGWPAVAARPTLTRLDSIFADTLKDRVGNHEWVYADGLLKAAANNPTYATDPRALAVTPLRAASLKLDDRLPEPLASQLRTMIALQDARLVLIPTDVTIERTAAGVGRPVVRLVLVDPRSSVVRWIGRVTGDDARAFTPDLSAILAARLADLFAAR
jgi:hypothetical protein